jgi:hypothetical protein
MRLALAATAVVLTCVGCGDGSSEESDSAPTSKAEYIERVDSICQQLYEQRDPLEIDAAKAAQAGELDQAAEVFQNAAEITKNRLAEIRELPAPDGDEPAIAGILARGERTVEAADAATAAIRAEDAKALASESQNGLQATKSFNKAAIEYGFFVCGRGAAVEIG